MNCVCSRMLARRQHSVGPASGRDKISLFKLCRCCEQIHDSCKVNVVLEKSCKLTLIHNYNVIRYQWVCFYKPLWYSMHFCIDRHSIDWMCLVHLQWINAHDVMSVPNQWFPIDWSYSSTALWICVAAEESTRTESTQKMFQDKWKQTMSYQITTNSIPN